MVFYVPKLVRTSAWFLWMVVLAICLYPKDHHFSRVLPNNDLYQASLPPMPGSLSPDSGGQSAMRTAARIVYQSGSLDLVSGSLKTPADLHWIGDTDAGFATIQMGQPSTQDLKAVLLPAKSRLSGTPSDAALWGMTVGVMPGHLDDGDYAAIDSAVLLKSLTGLNAQANQHRATPITLVGWDQPPQFDAARHVLTWAKRYKFGTRTVTTYSLRLFTRAETLMLDSLGDPQQLAVYQRVGTEVVAALAIPPEKSADASERLDPQNFLDPELIFSTAGEKGLIAMRSRSSSTIFIVLAVLTALAVALWFTGKKMTTPPPVPRYPA